MIRFVLVQLRLGAVDADCFGEILLVVAIFQRMISITMSTFLHREHASRREMSELVATVAPLHEYPIRNFVGFTSCKHASDLFQNVSDGRRYFDDHLALLGQEHDIERLPLPHRGPDFRVLREEDSFEFLDVPLISDVLDDHLGVDGRGEGDLQLKVGLLC